MRTTGQNRRADRHSSEDGYSIVETLIVVIVISILALVVFSRYEKTVYEARKTALKSELNNIRQAIVYFRITKGRYPASLREMLETRAILPHSDTGQKVFLNSYLEHQAMDDKKNLIDPFGAPFDYQPASGVVKSASKGFEEW